MKNLLRLPLQRPPLPPQAPHHLIIIRNKKANLPPLGPHALDGPGNSRQVPSEPGIPFKVLEPVHPELAAGRLQAEVDDDALGVILPASRAVEPGAEGAEVLFEDVGGVGLRDQPADVHDRAEDGGLVGRWTRMSVPSSSISKALENLVWEKDIAAVALFSLLIFFFRGAVWPTGAGNAGMIVG
jgi:hypothetical protein